MNCQPIKDILRYHKIDRRQQQEKKQAFENTNFKCVTQPDLNGVPLTCLRCQCLYRIIKNVTLFYTTIMRKVKTISSSTELTRNMPKHK